LLKFLVNVAPTINLWVEMAARTRSAACRVNKTPASKPDNESSKASNISRKKSTVFRVTGLPASQPDLKLKKALKATIDRHLAADENSKLAFTVAIVPSCYDIEEKVALVEFHSGVPGFLSDLAANPEGGWQDEMGDNDINFDRHFFGFTQLYAPKPGSPVTAE
jgi:hypothetical protein